jgi:hypothetical protein
VFPPGPLVGETARARGRRAGHPRAYFSCPQPKGRGARCLRGPSQAAFLLRQSLSRFCVAQSNFPSPSPAWRPRRMPQASPPPSLISEHGLQWRPPPRASVASDTRSAAPTDWSDPAPPPAVPRGSFHLRGPRLHRRAGLPPASWPLPSGWSRRFDWRPGQRRS